MKFLSIHIKLGLLERVIDFSRGVNLVYSKENSSGKTTLLRLMLYSLGYLIPKTKNFDFAHCEVRTRIWSQNLGEVIIERYCPQMIDVTNGAKKTMYTLPNELNDFHATLFGSDNVELLENLLGVFYIDQEKGWTLLNRGVVVGSIRFNVEGLIRGLSGCDCSNLLKQKEKIKREIERYNYLFNVAQYRERLILESKDIVVESPTIEINIERERLLMQEKEIRRKIKNLKMVLEGNTNIKKLIGEMKLIVRLPNGESLFLTSDRIEGLDDSLEYVKSKIKLAMAELDCVMNDLKKISIEKSHVDEQSLFINSESILEIFDKKIVELPIDPIMVRGVIEQLTKVKKKIKDEIQEKTRANRDVLLTLYRHMSKYAKELYVAESESLLVEYLFTSNLKELSGAILHKTVFAFKLAYIATCDEILGLKLPIILDSPSGKEVDHKNVEQMMQILKRDFSQHQIIIASIFKYDTFENMQITELKDQLLEFPQQG